MGDAPLPMERDVKVPNDSPVPSKEESPTIAGLFLFVPCLWPAYR